MAEPIEFLKKRFAGEWLAIRVEKEDALGNSLAGDVLAHDADYHRLHEAIRRKNLKNILIAFAGPIPAPGYGVLFSCSISLQ